MAELRLEAVVVVLMRRKEESGQGELGPVIRRREGWEPREDDGIPI